MEKFSPEEIKQMEDKAEEIMAETKEMTEGEVDLKKMSEEREEIFDAGYAYKEKENRQEAESSRAWRVLKRFLNGEDRSPFIIHLVGGNQINVSNFHRGRRGDLEASGIISLAGNAFIHDEYSGENKWVDIDEIEKIIGASGKEEVYFERRH